MQLTFSPNKNIHKWFHQEVWKYFLSRDWAGSKWHPVLKVWGQLQDKYSRVMQNSYGWEPLAKCKIYSQSSNYPSHNWEILTWKFWSCSSSSFFFVMHNSKTVWRIRAIYTPNDFSTVRDFPFLGWSCMQAKIGELWLQTRITVSLLYGILCILTHNSKLAVVQGNSTYQITALLLKISIFWIQAVCEIDRWVIDPTPYCNPFLTQHFVRTYTHNSKSTSHTYMYIWMFYISNDCSTIED